MTVLLRRASKDGQGFSAEITSTRSRMPSYKTYNGELASKVADYRSKGQKEASRNRPAPDSASPDQHESALRSDAETCMHAQQRLFDTSLTEISRDVTGSQHKLVELRGQIDMLLSDDSVETAVESELAGFRPTLTSATEKRLRAEAEIRYFRAVNNIHEDARYPESMYWHFGVIAVLALVETVANTFFYENGQGILGGFLFALGISVLNLVFAGMFGYGFRNKNLAAPDRRVMGWTCLVGFVLVALFANALFAAFRSQYQLVADPSELSQMNLAFKTSWSEAMSLFRADMQFQDISSFILFGLGIALSLAAFWKGYTLDDKFPGYGAKDRLYQSTLSLERQLQAQVHQKIRDMLHQRKAAVQTLIQEPTSQVSVLARRTAELTHMKGILESSAGAVQRDFVMVTEAYRHANSGVRSVPAPAYFTVTPELSQKADSSGADRILADLEAVQTGLRELGEQYREPLKAKLQTLQTGTTEILNELQVHYLAGVLKDAEEEIARRTPTLHRVQPA